MTDILSQIIEKRKADLLSLGVTFGIQIPEKRTRPVVPFLSECGTILEVKRASPSKGNIAPDLNPVELAKTYASAGTQAISVLTEPHFFKGSLTDLIQASGAIHTCSFLRKDFILEEEEIEVSYRCGADAVLLIARILETPLLLKLAARCRDFGMTPFIEIRSLDDLEKLKAAAAEGMVVGGVNARDLATFRLDPLIPAARRDLMPCKAVFESGALTPEAAAKARMLGFEGILIGEAAAKNPESAENLVRGFVNARPNPNGSFWKEIAKRREVLKKEKNARPLVKICGITNEEDAFLAKDLGADLLGFVFAESPRKTSATLVKNLREKLQANSQKPLLVGVITNPGSPEGKEAIALAQEGVLDAVQFHGISLPAFDAENDFAFYAALRVGSNDDMEQLQELLRKGEPRVMIDSRTPACAGGSGIPVSETWVEQAKDLAPLWLAGGISPENVEEIFRKWKPELIDLSSQIEAALGKKDSVKMKLFFEKINRSFS